MKTAFARTLSLALVLALSGASVTTSFAASTAGNGRGGGSSSSGGASAGGGNRSDTFDTLVIANGGDCRGNTCGPRHRVPRAAPCGSDRYVGPAGEIRFNCGRETHY